MRKVQSLVDSQLKELGKVMHALHTAFTRDTLEISDSIETVLPWASAIAAFMKLVCTGKTFIAKNQAYGPTTSNFYLEPRSTTLPPDNC